MVTHKNFLERVRGQLSYYLYTKGRNRAKSAANNSITTRSTQTFYTPNESSSSVDVPFLVYSLCASHEWQVMPRNMHRKRLSSRHFVHTVNSLGHIVLKHEVLSFSLISSNAGRKANVSALPQALLSPEQSCCDAVTKIRVHV